jgi:hypothetical protein
MAKAPERMQRRHVREKATIDHLVQDVYKLKPPEERHASHSPTTSTGLPVEDQVRKEWDPRKGRPSHFLTNDPDFTQAVAGDDGHSAPSQANEIDIAGCATVSYASEEPAHRWQEVTLLRNAQHRS